MYRRDVFRWMGDISVSNRSFPRKVGGQMDVYRGVMRMGCSGLSAETDMEI